MILLVINWSIFTPLYEYIMKVFGYYIKAIKNYINFEGRANRSEFWYFILFDIIISAILASLSQSLANIYSLLVLIPTLAVGARRLHDIGKSGWMQLVGLIPLIGWIWLIILFAKKGDTGENKYGKPSLGLSQDDKKDLQNLQEKVQGIANKVDDISDTVSEKTEELIDEVKEN